MANLTFVLRNFSNQSRWKNFTVDDKVESNKEVFIEIGEKTIRTYRNIEVYKKTREYNYVIRRECDIMLVSKDWSKSYILPLNDIENETAFFLQVFYTHAVINGMIQLHASIIAMGKKGIVFLGPSGIGKTTQAELWHKYRGALLINGDVVFVQKTKDEFVGWGTPWHGSSPYCENTSVPLRAMIVLKQAPENSIRELTGFEKVSAVSNNVFYPTWLENGMELCLETLDHLLSRIPVYELSCRPDEEAVKLTEETIFGSGSVSD